MNLTFRFCIEKKHEIKRFFYKAHLNAIIHTLVAACRSQILNI